ncbi:MAG: hypothetical protein IKE78_05440 [Erysipelotrichaceae bacterium]|nr:hypothetical protein [Erysipelotrichaceae bacterium]MBR6957608.1 hypothetical protein [Erysipelotrichaceae bacterium]
MKNREKILGMISLTAGILFLAVMIFNSVVAVRGLSEEYQKVINYNGTDEVILTLSYDDGFYGSVGFGMTPEVGRQSVMTEISLFARNSLKAIDRRIISCGITYTLFAVALMGYGLYVAGKDDPKKQVLKTTAIVIIMFTVFMITVIIAHNVLKVAFYPPDGFSLLLLETSLLSVIGGMCAVGLAIRNVRFHLVTAIIAVPLVFVLFLFSTQFEFRLNVPDRIYPAEYPYDQHGPGYSEIISSQYTGKKEETEYPENPDALTGIGRIGAIVYEAADPFSGSTLFTADEMMAVDGYVKRVGLIQPMLYALKAIAWIAAGLFLNKGNK